MAENRQGVVAELWVGGWNNNAVQEIIRRKVTHELWPEQIILLRIGYSLANETTHLRQS